MTDNSEKLAALSALVKSGECIAFLGAGMSFPDYPSWSELVETLRKACRLAEIVPQSINEDDPLKVASLAKQCDSEAFERTIRSELAPLPHTLDRYLHLANAPFSKYLTTNYEDGMLKALQHLNGGSARFQTYPHFHANRSERDVIFLHGRIDDSQDLQIVLTREDYIAAYGHDEENDEPRACDSMLPAFLIQTLPFANVCFLGCSLRDLSLQRILRICNRWRERVATPNGSAQWFALLPENSETAPLFENCGVTTVSYDDPDGKHAGLELILKAWAGHEPTRSRELAPPNKLYNPEAGFMP